MFLRSVAIENFRAVTSVRFELDRSTTVLIGENGSGKTSIFDALAACLGVRDDDSGVCFEQPDFRPLTDVPAPIRIVLTFVEAEPGEWDAALREMLGATVVPAEEGRLAIHWQTRAVWNPDTGAAEVTGAFLDAKGEVIDEGCVPERVAELRNAHSHR